MAICTPKPLGTDLKTVSAAASSLIAAVLTLSCALVGCGAANAGHDAQTAEARAPSSTAPTAPQTASAQTPPAANAEPPAAEPTPEQQLADAEKAKADSAPPSRDITYRVTPQGLLIDIEGVRFAPKAAVKKLDKGAFGIELQVGVEARDERTHQLANPTLGPLSMAVTLRDKRGKEIASYSDRREGDEPLFVMPGSGVTLERSWPSGEVKGPLWWGQTAHLEVGLWGLGADGDPGRPVRKLFVVDLTGGSKPQAVISPPEM